MRIVFDANVVVAGAGWRGESHLCLIALARRRLQAYASVWTLDELRTTCSDLDKEKRFRHSPWTILNWYYCKVRMIEPADLGKQRSRDAKDDPYLAVAVAAGAKLLCSHDRDLLDLEKPFGIQIVTPRILLSRLYSLREV